MKKVLFYAFLLPAFVGMMFSCSDVKTDVKKLEGKWNVVEVKGEKVLEEGLPQMDFNMAEKKLHGNTGCNLFNTTITLDPEDVYYDRSGRYDDDGLSEYGFGDERASIDGSGSFREGRKR